MSSTDSPMHSNRDSPKRKSPNVIHLSNEATSSRRSSVRRSSHKIPHSKLTGVLKELKDDIVLDAPLKLKGGCGDAENEMIPVYGKDEIYIESHGKFIKAPKEIISENNFKNSDNQDEPWSFDMTTPLDIVITVQNMWTLLGKILLGFSAGLALTETILILLYYSTYQGDNFFDFYSIYSIFTNKLESVYYVLMVIGVSCLLDWLDIAHINLRDLFDTLQYRKIWIVAFMYIVAAGVMFALSSWSDFIYLRCYNYSVEKVSRDVLENDMELLSAVNVWNAGSLVKDILIIISWICVVCIKSDDLFLIHLMELKKYDYPYDQILTQAENHI
ncbi:uncharacterized protein LOC106661895 isoform X2 [Cimex lectularius]|nr:uncharacterized protein LOC106661895 isoform X2 [Cimex lectularius]